MRFPMPHYPCEFEIPDDWLSEAGVIGFAPTASAYNYKSPTKLIPLAEIEPPPRLLSSPNDWCGFNRGRLIGHLRRFVASDKTDPVPVVELPEHELGHSKYRICDRYHRFYGSIVAGFSYLPAII